MARLAIPVPPQGVGVWTVRVELDSKFYRFLYKYNKRNETWFIDFANDAGIAQVRGRRVVLVTDMLFSFKHLEVPQGIMNVVDTRGESVEPTKVDLGARHRIEYTEVE